MNQYKLNLFLAEIHKNSGSYKDAIFYFKRCHFIIPNRFIPSYNLMSLYENMGDTLNADKWKQVILSTPIKVPSQQVFKLKSIAESKNYMMPK